jgi:type 1 glutamine amidotransferase
MQRFLGITSAAAAALSLFLVVFSWSGARPFEQSSSLFVACIALALVTSTASQRVLSPHLKSLSLIQKLTLQPTLPKWAALAVWVVTGLGLAVAHGVHNSDTADSTNNSFSLLASTGLFVFFFGNAVVLLLVSARVPESKDRDGGA